MIVAQCWGRNLGSEIGQGIEDYVRKKPAWVIRKLDHNFLLDHIKKWRFDALIFPFTEEVDLHTKNIKAVAVSTHYRPDKPRISQVDINPIAAGETAADFFLSKNFNFFCSLKFIPLHTSAIDRYAQSFVRHLEKNNILPKQITTLDGRDTLALRKWLKHCPKPVAVFSLSAPYAVRLMNLAIEEGFCVPDDVSILTCQGGLNTYEQDQTLVSFIQFPYRKVGTLAAQTLDRLLAGKGKPETILLPPGPIVERGSTCRTATVDIHLRKALNFIHEHLHSRIEIRVVAQHSGLALRMLQRHFQQEMQCSPSVYIYKAKINRAKEMLREADKPLEEIALDLGYPSGNYLAKIFKKETGQTPRQYQQQFRP